VPNRHLCFILLHDEKSILYKGIRYWQDGINDCRSDRVRKIQSAPCYSNPKPQRNCIEDKIDFLHSPCSRDAGSVCLRFQVMGVTDCQSICHSLQTLLIHLDISPFQWLRIGIRQRVWLWWDRHILNVDPECVAGLFALLTTVIEVDREADPGLRQ